ncbi:MAG: hypothetical protein AAB304_03190, partial [Pseudomonadota bacterium]
MNAASPASAAGSPPPPLPSNDPLMRQFDELIGARHARLAHQRAHPAVICPECRRFVAADAEAQAAYDAALHEQFDGGNGMTRRASEAK